MSVLGRFLVLTILLLLSLPANAEDSYTVRALLMEALSSPDGKAHGVIEGQEADAIHQATRATDPIIGEIRTIKRLQREGCSRLQLKLIQPNTPAKDGGLTDFFMEYELNLCKDGAPPVEGVDAATSQSWK